MTFHIYATIFYGPYRIVFFEVEKCDAAYDSLHAKAIWIFQHIYLMYANDLAVLNEGAINHYNDGLF